MCFLSKETSQVALDNFDFVSCEIEQLDSNMERFHWQRLELYGSTVLKYTRMDSTVVVQSRFVAHIIYMHVTCFSCGPQTATTV